MIAVAILLSKQCLKFAYKGLISDKYEDWKWPLNLILITTQGCILMNSNLLLNEDESISFSIVIIVSQCSNSFVYRIFWKLDLLTNSSQCTSPDLGLYRVPDVTIYDLIT